MDILVVNLQKSLSAMGSAPRPLFRFNDERMRTTLLPLILLADADSWQFLSKAKLIFYIFCPSPVQKTFPRH